MVNFLPWIALVVLAASCPKAWSAAPGHSQLDVGNDTTYETNDDEFKPPVFSSTRTKFPLGLRAHGFSKLRGFNIVALVVAASAVLFLVSTCVRVMQSSAPSGGAANRSLAMGGQATVCTEVVDEEVHANNQGNLLLPAGEEQLRLLQLLESDSATLTPEEQAVVLDGKQRLQCAIMECKGRAKAVRQQQAVVIRMQNEARAQEEAFRKGTLAPGTPDANAALRQQTALLGVATDLYLEATRTLEAMIWTSNQDIITLIRLADAYMERELTPAAAAALAAAEQVIYQGQKPVKSPAPHQMAKIHQMASAAMNSVTEKRSELESAQQVSLSQLVRSRLLVKHMVIFIRQLRSTGLHGPAAQLEDALSGLKNAVATHSKFPTTPSSKDGVPRSQSPQQPPKSATPPSKPLLPPFKSGQHPDGHGELPLKGRPKSADSSAQAPPLPQKMSRSSSDPHMPVKRDVNLGPQAPALPPKSRTPQGPPISSSGAIVGSPPRHPLSPIAERTLPKLTVGPQSINLSGPSGVSSPQGPQASPQTGATASPGTEEQASGDAAEPQSSQELIQAGASAVSHTQEPDLAGIARKVTAGLRNLRATLEEGLSGDPEKTLDPQMEAVVLQAITVVENAEGVNVPPSLPKKLVDEFWKNLLAAEQLLKKAVDILSPKWQDDVTKQQQSLLQAAQTLRETRAKAKVPSSDDLLRSIIACQQELKKARAQCARLQPATVYGPASLVAAVGDLKESVFSYVPLVIEEGNALARQWQELISRRLKEESSAKDAGSSGDSTPHGDLASIIEEASEVVMQLKALLGHTPEVVLLGQTLQNLKDFVEGKRQKRR